MDEEPVKYQHILLQNNNNSSSVSPAKNKTGNSNGTSSWDTRSIFDKIIDDVELTVQVTNDEDDEDGDNNNDNLTDIIGIRIPSCTCISSEKIDDDNNPVINVPMLAAPPSKDDEIFSKFLVQEEDNNFIESDSIHVEENIEIDSVMADSIPLLHTNISFKDKSDFNERILDYLSKNDNDSINDGTNDDDSCNNGILETIIDDKSSIDPIENDMGVLRRVAKIGVCKAIPTTPCGECRTLESFDEEFPLNQSIFIQMNTNNDNDKLLKLNDDEDEKFDPLNDISTNANADFEWRELNENPDDNVLALVEDTDTVPNLFDKLNDDKESSAVVSSIGNGEVTNSALQCNFESEFQSVGPMFTAAFHTITSEFNSSKKSVDVNGTNNKNHSNKNEKDDNDKNHDKGNNNISQKSSKIIPLIRPPPESKLKKWEEEQNRKNKPISPEETIQNKSEKKKESNNKWLVQSKITSSYSIDKHESTKSCTSSAAVDTRIHQLERLMQTWNPFSSSTQKQETRSDPCESSGATYREPYHSPDLSESKKASTSNDITTTITHPIFNDSSESSREKAKQKWYARNSSKSLEEDERKDDTVANNNDGSSIHHENETKEKNDALMVISALSDILVPNVENSSEPMENKSDISKDVNVKDTLDSTKDVDINDTNYSKELINHEVDYSGVIDSKALNVDVNIITTDIEKDSKLEHSLHDASLTSLSKSNSIVDPILAEKITLASARVSDKFEEEYKNNTITTSQEIVEKESDGMMMCTMLNSAVGDGLLDIVCTSTLDDVDIEEEVERGVINGRGGTENVFTSEKKNSEENDTTATCGFNVNTSCINPSFLVDTTTDANYDNVIQSHDMSQISELSVSDKGTVNSITNIPYSSSNVAKVTDKANNNFDQLKYKSKRQRRRRRRLPSHNECNYMKPPLNSPSPFELSTSTQPYMIKTILSFLGNPESVCSVKCVNKFCCQYVIDNEHVLMRDSVRLGGLSKKLRPSFWLWILLEKCDRIRILPADECTERIAVDDTVPLNINVDEENENNDCEVVEAYSSSPPQEDSEVALKVNKEEQLDEVQPKEETTPQHQTFTDRPSLHHPPIDDYVLLENIGRYGEWNNLIQRDVARAFGNLPPHKTEGRIKANSIIPALIYRPPLQYAQPTQILDDEENNDEVNLSQMSIEPTDTGSDWGVFPPDDDESDSDCEQDDAVGAMKNDLCRKKIEIGVSSTESSPNKLSRCSQSDLTLSGYNLTAEAKVEMQSMLERILNAMSAAHPKVGYCQGMDYVVSHLLRFMKDTVVYKAKCGSLPSSIRSKACNANGDDSINLVIEEAVFRSMDTFFTIYSLRHMYWPELRCLKMCCRIFEKLIKLKLPVLADHFDHHDINIGMFGLGWFQTLFLYLPAMPSSTVCHMWDIWMVERSFKIFFRVGVAILFLSQPILLNHEMEGMMNYLNTFGADVTLFNPDILIPCALQFKITNRMIVELEQECLNNFF